MEYAVRKFSYTRKIHRHYHRLLPLRRSHSCYSPIACLCGHQSRHTIGQSAIAVALRHSHGMHWAWSTPKSARAQNTSYFVNWSVGLSAPEMNWLCMLFISSFLFFIYYWICWIIPRRSFFPVFGSFLPARSLGGRGDAEWQGIRKRWR